MVKSNFTFGKGMLVIPGGSGTQYVPWNDHMSHLTGKGKSSTHSAFKWDMLVFWEGRHKGPLFHCFDMSDQAVLKNIGPTK